MNAKTAEIVDPVRVKEAVMSKTLENVCSFMLTVCRPDFALQQVIRKSESEKVYC